MGKQGDNDMATESQLHCHKCFVSQIIAPAPAPAPSPSPAPAPTPPHAPSPTPTSVGGLLPLLQDSADAMVPWKLEPEPWGSLSTDCHIGSWKHWVPFCSLAQLGNIFLYWLYWVYTGPV